MWPARLSEFFGVVYTFEPNPELFYCLTQNAPQRNILRYQAALGKFRDKVDMSWGYSRNNYGGYYTVEGGVTPTMRVDDLHLQTCDLLMLDIEGRELEALQGSVETISNCSPVIVWESKEICLKRFGASKQTVRDWLQDKGYKHSVSFHGNRDELWVPIQ